MLGDLYFKITKLESEKSSDGVTMLTAICMQDDMIIEYTFNNREYGDKKTLNNKLNKIHDRTLDINQYTEKIKDQIKVGDII